MTKKQLSEEQRKLEADLWAIALISLGILGVYIFFQNQVAAVIKDSGIHILLRVLLGAVFQFGLAGFGIVVVAIFRKENLLAYGLNKKRAFLSIFLCSLCFVPYLVFMLLTGQITSYLPFQSVWTTQAVLLSGFPVNMIGMLITAVAWGFFEGFNYVVISEKINRRYPGKNRWLNWGAIVCTVLCILIHGAIGVTAEGIVEMLTIVIIVYGMLMVKEFTGNAWGCVVLFVFFWNAF
ncbi:MAG: hypothetical protein QM697_04075 [Lachnospiraceae bacterium]